MKARRNQASEEIAKLKKAGQDASAQMAETKQLREQIQEKERAANQLEVRLHEILAGIPNIPHESVPVGKGPRITLRSADGARRQIRISLRAALGLGEAARSA